MAQAPALSSGRALALALARTLGCARALLRPWSVLLLKLKLLVQAHGFGHHLPSLPSAKLLAFASRWPLLLAPTSRRSIPTRQFASTSPQSSWTIFSRWRRYYGHRLHRHIRVIFKTRSQQYNSGCLFTYTCGGVENNEVRIKMLNCIWYRERIR